MTMTTKQTLGFIERIAFDDLDIDCKAKVDTGACSSSLHAERIEVFQRDGNDWVRFHVLFDSNKARIDRLCEAPVLTQRHVTSSNGQTSHRYVIAASVTLAGQQFTTEVTLSHRGNMTYPVLIGRKALSGRFIVDVSQSFAGDKKG